MRWLLAILLTCYLHGAAFYYVSPTGNNGNDGQTPGAPKTLAGGIALGGPDVTLYLLDGEYEGLVDIYNIGGTSGHPFLLKAVNQWQAHLTKSQYEGLRASGTSHYIWVDGLQVSHSDKCGITLDDGAVIRNCWVHHTTNESGINFFPDHFYSDSWGIIESNLVELNGATGQHHGIYWHGVSNIVRGNIARSNSGWGLHLYTGTAGVTNHGNLIYNNLTYGNGTLSSDGYGITVWSANGNDGSCPGTNWVFNNTICDGLDVDYGTLGVTNNIILLGQDGHRIKHSGSRPTTVYADYNLSDGVLEDAGAHDVVASPGFVGAPDYRLAAGSAAIGSASDRGSTFALDLLSTSRPQGAAWDIGCYEYVYPAAGGTVSGVMSVTGSLKAGSVVRP